MHTDLLIIQSVALTKQLISINSDPDTIFCSGRLVKIIIPKTLHFNVLMRNGIKKSDYH